MITVKRLVELGGTEWQQYGKHRVYFNAEIMCNLYGLTVEYYNSGKICRAWLIRDGEREQISNTQANEIIFSLSGINKLYYDVQAQQWGGSLDNKRIAYVMRQLVSLLSAE